MRDLVKLGRVEQKSGGLGSSEPRIFGSSSTGGEKTRDMVAVRRAGETGPAAGRPSLVRIRGSVGYAASRSPSMHSTIKGACVSPELGRLGLSEPNAFGSPSPSREKVRHMAPKQLLNKPGTTGQLFPAKRR